jgi:RND family efflux transporter MFP subunit
MKLHPLFAASIAACTATTAQAEALDCMIQPHQVVQVGSAAPGVIERIAVDRGDLVTRGQPIVHLNASVERAALAVARERAQSNGETTIATSSQELAQSELQRAKELYEKDFVSKTYLEKARAESGVAGGRTDQAQERRKLATRELELAAAQLDLRTIRAPVSGVVVERFMSPGEYVEQKPILRLASIDPLRVDVLVPAIAFGQVEPGMKGSVVPELLKTGQHLAVVKSVDRVIDAASNTFRVRLELPNPDAAIPAGLRCKVDLGLKLPATAMPMRSTSAVPAGGSVRPAVLMR